jgi:hypothetical protein
MKLTGIARPKSVSVPKKMVAPKIQSTVVWLSCWTPSGHPEHGSSPRLLQQCAFARSIKLKTTG